MDKRQASVLPAPPALVALAISLASNYTSYFMTVISYIRISVEFYTLLISPFSCDFFSSVCIFFHANPIYKDCFPSSISIHFPFRTIWKSYILGTIWKVSFYLTTWVLKDFNSILVANVCRLRRNRETSSEK